MAIPTYEQFLLPLLLYSSDDKEHSSREPFISLAKRFNISDSELNQLLPNGSTVFYNRVGWAQTYLKQAGLLYSTRRGFFKITERGLQIIKQKPSNIDVRFLNQFPEFVEFSNRSRKDGIKDEKGSSGEEKRTPEEMMESGYALLQERLKDELLVTVKKVYSKVL